MESVGLLSLYTLRRMGIRYSICVESQVVDQLFEDNLVQVLKSKRGKSERMVSRLGYICAPESEYLSVSDS